MQGTVHVNVYQNTEYYSNSTLSVKTDVIYHLRESDSSLDEGERILTEQYRGHRERGDVPYTHFLAVLDQSTTRRLYRDVPVLHKLQILPILHSTITMLMFSITCLHI